MSQTGIPQMTLGQKIRRARKDAGLSHDGLVERIGSSRSHLIKLEKGQHRPTPEMLARIAEGTGKSIAFFEDGSAASDDEEAAELVPALLTALKPFMRLVALEVAREGTTA